MKYMSWSFWRFDYAMKEIYDNGDRFYQVGMFDYITEFTFKNPNLGYFDKENVSGITGKINLDVNKNSTDPNSRDSITVWNSYQEWVNKIKAKWPHIKWFLSLRNDGTYNAIKYLMDNVNNVQTTFLSEISRIIDENPWCYGIDLDLEHCGGAENADNMVALIKKVYQLVHSKGKKLHYDLPAMNGEYWSVGSENWCSYARLNPYLDSVTIMSYDFAWQGSAPSAVSPKWWLDLVYDYVAKSFSKEKVFMGLPGYGYCWQIYQYPSTDKSSSAYTRGHTLKYNELIEWQNGIRSHTDTQAKIPFASYVNDEEKCANMYLHVYDIQSYNDAIITPPVVKGEYKGIKYVSAYKKTKTYENNEIAVSQLVTEYYKAVGNIILIAEEKPKDQQTDNSTTDTTKDDTTTSKSKDDGSDEEGDKTNNPGNYDKNCDYAFTSATPNPKGQDYEQVWGIGEFRFNCSAGTYELALDINFTWFDRNIITVELDGKRYEAKMGSLIDNNCLRRHYHSLGMVTLTGGSHVLKYLCEFSSINALFYGFVLCKSVTTKINSGSAKFLIEPQTLYDVDMKPVKPKSYKLTFEVLRRNPDYCYIYSDDFRSYVEDFNIFTRYYDIKQGYFKAIGDPNDSCTLQHISDEVDSEFIMKYDKFGSITVNVQFKYQGTECGIIVGDSRVGIRGDSIVIYNGGTEAKTIYTPRIYKDKLNELKVRVRGTEGVYGLMDLILV